MLAALLAWLGRRGRVRTPGLFALYVASYSGFRIVEELLRVDPAHHILGLRLNFFAACLLCLAGLVEVHSACPTSKSQPSRSRGEVLTPPVKGL